jgi:hypothetical protein
MPLTTGGVLLATAFINSVGINTHLHGEKFGYENRDTVATAIQYLGVKNVRDSAQSQRDVQIWTAFAQTAGVKFDDYMPEGSPDDMRQALTLVPQLAAAGVLNFVEGANEEDAPYAIKAGNSLALAATFQQQVYQTGHSLGLPVINMSFGQGWTAANNWHGNYDKVGDLSHFADFANAHTYPKSVVGEPRKSVARLNDNAKLAASSKPVIVTELGWKSTPETEQSIAVALINGLMDAVHEGAEKTYIYALFDDQSGHFGIMNSDGSPKPAGTALHTLMALLSDPLSRSTEIRNISYKLDGASADDRSLAFQKSDGTYWIAIWNDTGAQHSVTLKLAAPARELDVFDPFSGTDPVQSRLPVGAATIALADHLLLVRVSH